MGHHDGDPNVVVAITDSGMNLTHPDLVKNLWTNPIEIPGDPNGIDEDGCGFIDDVHGYDFNTPDPDPHEERRNSHGSFVAGIIGAEANGGNVCTIQGGEPPGQCQGIAGINWDVKMMPLRVIRPLIFGASFLDAAIAGIEYATCWNVDVINASWGTQEPSQALEDAIREAGEHEIVFVTSAGNDNIDIDDPNVNAYPEKFDLENVITVAAINCLNNKSSFSNYGGVSVDLAAPGGEDPVLGVELFSTGGKDETPLIDQYVSGRGTSFAAPQVTGVAALMRALTPEIPVERVRAHLLDPNNLDTVPDLDPSGPTPTVTGGRLNASKVLDDHDPDAPAAVGDLSPSLPTSSSVRLNWTATAEDGTDPNTGPATLYEVRYSLNPIDPQNRNARLNASMALGVPTPGAPGSPESMSVTGLSPNKIFHFALRAYDRWGNGPISNVVSCKTQGPCTSSFCKVGQRCTYAGNGGCDGCCNYTCVVDPTCTDTDPCPTNACPGVCGGGF